MRGGRFFCCQKKWSSARVYLLGYGLLGDKTNKVGQGGGKSPDKESFQAILQQGTAKKFPLNEADHKKYNPCQKGADFKNGGGFFTK